MALPDSYSNNSPRISLSGTNGATFIVFSFTAAITIVSNAWGRVVEATRELARSIREIEIPSLREFRLPPPPALLTRIVLRPVAPVLAMEPAFVGGGLAFRRWR